MNTISNGINESRMKDKNDKKLVNSSRQVSFEIVYKEKTKNMENEGWPTSRFSSDHEYLLSGRGIAGSPFDELIDGCTNGFITQYLACTKSTLNNTRLDGIQINVSVVDAADVITEIIHKVSVLHLDTSNMYKTILFLPNIGDLKLEIFKKKNAETTVTLKKTQSENSVADIDLQELSAYLEERGVDCSVG